MKARKVLMRPFIDEKIVRQMLNTIAVLSLGLIFGLLTSVDAGACASCGCTLSPDWESQQFSYTPGIKLDLRWDYLNQNQLRSGTGTISPTAASHIVNNGSPQEIEKYTKNNYFTMGIDYSNSPDWGINIQVPYIDRSHSTLGTASDGFTPGPGGGQYDSHTSNLGDIKVVGRYQGFVPGCSALGVILGGKLPTGSHTETAASTDPTAPGQVPIDRGLQPGTGTTDVIVGAYYTNALGINWGYFAQAIFQTALNSKDEYKPGNGLNLNGGFRYLGFSGFYPQVQLNFRAVKRDSGANADTVSTGGTLLYFSPGIDVPVSSQVSIYGFVQVPIYQNLNGVQLAPHYSTSLGVRYVF